MQLVQFILAIAPATVAVKNLRSTGGFLVIDLRNAIACDGVRFPKRTVAPALRFRSIPRLRDM